MEKQNIQKKEQPVLIVDDEKAIQLYHKAALEKYFEKILLAEDGQEAWNIFQQEEPIPVVITDIDMPKMDGINLISKIYKASPSTQIIIVSVLTENIVSLFSIRSNTAYLPKPVDKHFLRMSVFRAYAAYSEALWLENLKKAAQEDPRDIDKIFSILDIGSKF